METGFLNFHDEEHFADFSLSLDHQHNLLGEPQSSLTEIVNHDFDYVERLGFDSTDTLWETEQELNGDLAVLPVSGVSGVIPKMENIKEDFAKVLTDWQEHIGFLQATEIEEDIDMVNLDMDLNINADLVDKVPENSPKPKPNVLSSPVKLAKLTSVPDSPVKPKTNRYTRQRVSESDQSEKEIDVVGLDSFEEINSDFDFMHVRRQHVTAPSKEYNCKILGNTVIKIKQEVLDVKEDSTEYEDEAPQTDLSLLKTDKKKSIKKHKEDITNKKRRRSVKETVEATAKVSKKSKKQIKTEKFIEETSNSNNVPLSPKKTPVLEAGDVKSLLEQFEATEAAAQLSASPLPETMEIPTKKTRAKPSVNKSQVTLLKKSVESQDSKLHKDIRDSLPKEVIDRIKASGRKKMISVIPAIPNTKTGSRNNGTRMQEAAATLSRNKLLKLVTNNISNSNGRVDGSVQLDHDYCSNSNSAMSSSSSISSCDSNSEYDRRMSDSEPQTPIKEVAYNKKNESLEKGPFELTKTGHKLTIGSARKNNWSDSNSKKDSGLESGDVSDASEEQQQQQQSLPLSSPAIKSPSQESSSTNTGNRKSLLANKATQPKPVYEMKIQSALATSILQLRNGVLTKTKSLEAGMKPKQQMVSVLKKPPMATTPQKVLGANLKESIVTTTNSSNDQVQNIIVQDTTDVELPEETEKKPPRRKLNLAEYRSRREQNRSDGSRTSSPVQPMVLVYVHHVSTNTEPINDDPENPMWSEREIVSVLKPKAEVEEEKVRPKPVTRDRGMQTVETVFGVVYEEQEEEEEAIQPEPVREEAQTQTQSVTQTETETEPQEEMEQESAVEEGEVEEEDAVEAENDEQEVVASANNENDAVTILDVNEEAVEEGEVPESGEIVNDDVAIVEGAVACNTVSEKEEDAATKVADGEEKITQTTSINRVRDRRHRNYRRARSSSSSSRSRSRSRSRVRASRRSRSHSRSRSRARSRSRSRSRSRGKARDERSSRSRSRSPSSGSSRSRSRSRSRRQRNPRRRRRISHRRSSVSSTSSWYSRSRSRSRYRSSSSRSRSRSSRSRSRSSRYSSCSRSSSRSNFGRSKWSSRRRKEKRDRQRSCSRRRRHSSGSSHGYNDWRRSPLPYRRPYDEWYLKEKQRQVEERRVIYVGRLKEGITKAELRRRFETFGPVVDISIHFRERGHNYGFVTFAYKNDAYEAVEHGNDDPSLPRYDLCFGGRRAFCKVKYADLDGAASTVNGRNMYKPEEENTFDLLLKEAQAKLRKRKV